MFTYLIRHLAPVLVTAALVFGSGCASQGPKVSVLGVTQPRQQVNQEKILVFVEVVNPGSHDLELSRLEYSFQASEWLRGSGEVALARQVAPGSSAVVEIAVPVKERADKSQLSGVPFTLEGRLFARDDRLERSWSVKAKGALGRASGSAGGAVQVRVATR